MESAPVDLPANAHDGERPIPQVCWGDVLRTWSRLAALSFGGPAGQIALMHRLIVDEKEWVSEQRFLHALRGAAVLFCTPCRMTPLLTKPPDTGTASPANNSER